jgi:16S rRNA (guanine966-N2)-methyltransferase
VEQSEALDWLGGPGRAGSPFDIVFLDPPYGGSLLPATIAALESSGCLAPDAWVYLEDAADRGAPAVPPYWQLLRSKRAGDVGYHLARRVTQNPRP